MTLQKITKILIKEIPTIEAIYLFGSYDTQFATPESDIDLAVLADIKLEPEPLWDTAQKIALLLKRDIDLLDLKQVSTIMQFQVLSQGTRIYCKNKTICDTFETIVYSEYVNFCDLRKTLIDDITKRGTIY